MDKIELALKEIGHCEIKVKVADGVIVSICKGRYFTQEKNGVKKEIIIEKPITR